MRCSQAQLWSRLRTMRPQLQILRWHCQRQNRSNDPDLGKTLRWFWSDAKWLSDLLRYLARNIFPQANVSDSNTLLSLRLWPCWIPSLPSMRENPRAGIPTLLWSLRTMFGLERLLQSDYHPASAVTLAAAYLLIRSALFICWPLLLYPFPSSIFLHLSIDFLFADFQMVLTRIVRPFIFIAHKRLHVKFKYAIINKECLLIFCII